MLMVFLCHRARAIRQFIQTTGLFLSKEDAVLPNPAWWGRTNQPLLLKTLGCTTLQFHTYFSYV